MDAHPFLTITYMTAQSLQFPGRSKLRPDPRSPVQAVCRLVFHYKLPTDFVPANVVDQINQKPALQANVSSFQSGNMFWV